MGAIDAIDIAGMSDADDLLLPSPGSGKTESGRTSFKNKLTKLFGSKYRDHDNTKTLMGRTHAPQKGVWHHGSLHIWARPADRKAQTYGSIGVLEECSQVLLEQGQHQDRFGVARSEGAGHLYAGVIEHCPGLFQDEPAEQCPH